MIYMGNLEYKHRVIFLKAATLLVQNLLPYRGRVRWRRDALKQPGKQYTEIAADDTLFREACQELAELIQKYL